MKLFYRHFGKGNPVVILHGLFGISDNWVTFGRKLAEDYEVFIPDLRNHGQSPHSAVFDFPSLAEDLFEFCEDHDLHRIILIGHSLGGKTAMEFTRNYPERINKLIIVDISMRKYGADRDHQQLINAMLDVDFSNAQSRSDIDRQLAKSVKSIKLRQFLLKSIYWRDKTHLDWRLNLEAINTNLPFLFEAMSPGIHYHGPVLFVRGGLSDYVPDGDLAEIRASFPDARIETVSGASHWVHADAPEEFYQIIREFASLRSE